MLDNKYFRYTFAILLILINLYLLQQLDYILRPLQKIFSTLVVPILIALFLYYLLRPMVAFLVKFVKHKSLAIIISYFFLFFLIILLSYYGGSIIQRQLLSLLNDFSGYYDKALESISEAFNHSSGFIDYLKSLKMDERLTALGESILNNLRQNIFGLFTTLTNLGTVIILIPFILYYLLKDDTVILANLIKLFPEAKQQQAAEIINKADKTLARYISGQLLVATLLGVLTFLGYSIIGLPNALILAFIALVTSFIPFIGPIIGVLPAVFIALTIDLFLVLKVLIVLVVVQQLEGNIIQPKIQGHRLEIHPLLVILVVLSFVILFGFLGAIFAVPIYAVARVIIRDARAKKLN